MIIERMRCKVDELTERCQEREHEIEGQRNELTIQQEQILSQQLLLQQQEQTVLLKERELLEQKEQVHDMSKQAQQTKESAKMRIASVQTSASLEFSSKSQQNETNMLYRPWTAPHTDPPEAVVQEFRTQSRLLLARLEEQDQVQTPVFSDSDLDDDKVSSESKKLGETVVLRRGAQPVADVYLDSQTDPGAVDILNTSIVDSQSDLKQTQYKYQDAMTKLRDLQLGIRLKEELIRELVQSSKQTDDINCQYLEKVKEMEREVEESQAGLEQMKKKLEEYERLADKTSVQHLRSEYKQKLVSLQQKVDTLQQQQKSSRQMSAIQEVSEKKLLAVEANLGRMKNAQEALKHKLKKVAEEKLTIQRELERYQQQVSALEKKAEKQQLVLKEKTREAVSAGRRLRNQTLTQVDKSNREAGKLELEVKLAEKQQWLDAEVNSLLKERSDVQALQEDLARREKLVQEREAMLAERNALEMRILRSSQIVSKDVLRISTHLQSVESSITCKKQELKLLTNGDTTTANENVKMVKRALKNLQQEREKAIEASRQLETTLSDPQNERRMMALEEAIEALDGMLEYQDQSISEKESGMDESALGCEVPSDYIMSQLKDLSAADAQQLLGVYFEKVVLLREETRKKDTLCKELQLTIGEREQTIRDLEIAVQETSASAERRITQQEKESEQRVQFLVQQLADATSNNNQAHQQNATNKIQQLEKDLYYYKTTSRELKRRLREASNSQDIQPGKESPLNGGSLSEKSSLRKTRRELRQLSSSEIAARSSATEQNRDQ
ncbi:kinesin-like protein KIF27 isoform X2 [Corticium candelabrum]|uniref:kinesin-like protein KIF27 isoform X2 n=1 Tax=Corticium candelabrum TaxID=121492 RepID=UPI002E258C88|nr:kinesin-like protein KIF27 isoform X2 [Corticium candelabrum]